MTSSSDCGLLTSEKIRDESNFAAGNQQRLWIIMRFITSMSYHHRPLKQTIFFTPAEDHAVFSLSPRQIPSENAFKTSKGCDWVSKAIRRRLITSFRRVLAVQHLVIDTHTIVSSPKFDKKKVIKRSDSFESIRKANCCLILMQFVRRDRKSN